VKRGACSRFPKFRPLLKNLRQYHDPVTTISSEQLKMFATKILRGPARNTIRTATRTFSSLPPRSEPKSWTPVPYITETIVSPYPFADSYLILTIQGGGWRTCIPLSGEIQWQCTDLQLQPISFPSFSRYALYSSSCALANICQERIVCLNGEVNESLSAAIVAQLLFLESDAPDKAITLYINSPGGSVTAGLAIYDTMTYISSPVSTVCVGQAASMGSLLLCGGEKGKRFCLPHSSIMIHQPSGGYFGQASDIAIHATEILRVRKQLNEIYKRHLTKEISLEEIERLMERDKFLSANEALDLGIVDQILDKRVKEGDKDKEGAS